MELGRIFLFLDRHIIPKILGCMAIKDRARVAAFFHPPLGKDPAEFEQSEVLTGPGDLELSLHFMVKAFKCVIIRVQCFDLKVFSPRGVFAKEEPKEGIEDGRLAGCIFAGEFGHRTEVNLRLADAFKVVQGEAFELKNHIFLRFNVVVNISSF